MRIEALAYQQAGAPSIVTRRVRRVRDGPDEHAAAYSERTPRSIGLVIVSLVPGRADIGERQHVTAAGRNWI